MQQRCQGWCACLSAWGHQGCSTTRTESCQEMKVRGRWFETSEMLPGILNVKRAPYIVRILTILQVWMCLFFFFLDLKVFWPMRQARCSCWGLGWMLKTYPWKRPHLAQGVNWQALTVAVGQGQLWEKYFIRWTLCFPTSETLVTCPHGVLKVAVVFVSGFWTCRFKGTLWTYSWLHLGAATFKKLGLEKLSWVAAFWELLM